MNTVIRKKKRRWQILRLSCCGRVSADSGGRSLETLWTFDADSLMEDPLWRLSQEKLFKGTLQKSCMQQIGEPFALFAPFALPAVPCTRTAVCSSSSSEPFEKKKFVASVACWNKRRISWVQLELQISESSKLSLKLSLKAFHSLPQKTVPLLLSLPLSTSPIEVRFLNKSLINAFETNWNSSNTFCFKIQKSSKSLKKCCCAFCMGDALLILESFQWKRSHSPFKGPPVNLFGGTSRRVQ